MLRFILILPVLILLVLFALSNQQPADIGIWPTDYTLRAPLSLIVLVGMGFAFLVGALVVWGSVLAARARARRAAREVRLLEAQVAMLKAQLAAASAAPRPVVAAPPPGVPALAGPHG